MTDKQKVTTMADSDYVFGNFGGKVGQMSIQDFRSNIGSTTSGDSPDLSSLQRKVNANTTRISAVEYKNAEQDNRLSNAEEQNTKQNERLLNYVYPKLYQLNEGAGARAFHGFTEETGDGELILTKDTYRYSVLYSTTQKQFVLNVTDEASGVTVLYSSWPKISLPNNKSIASSESYAERDKLYYIYVSGEGSTYYYIYSDGVASEQSATYLLRRLVDKNASDIATASTAAQEAKTAAETAQTAADTAEETANSAHEKATEASTDAQEAKTAADNANNLATEAQSTATAAQTKNTEQDARLDNIEARIDPDIAGRVWTEDNGTPKAESYYGSVKALRDLPKRLGLGRYLVKDDRTRRKLDPNDSTKYLDGTPAALDGTDGQCMWCWNGFYANVWHEGSRLIKAVTFDGPVGNDISIWIPAGGISWLGAGVMDRTEQKLCSVISDDERYRGGGGTALDASKYSKAPADTTPQITMLGMPATNISTTNFGTYARKRGERGEGWEANWFVARFVVEFLFEVIMGTENSQEAFNSNKDANGLYQGGLGTGVTDMPDWGNYNGTYPVIPTSVGLEAGDGVCLVEYTLPDASGGTYKTFNVPVFFGLVGAGFGNLYQWTRGLIMDAGEEKSLVYVAPSMYADYDPNTVADKIMVAECPRVSGWIMRKSYKGLCCMPTAIGGSPTVRYSDQFYTSAETSKGLRVRAAGGYAGSGTSAGASCTYAARTAAVASADYSLPLCYFEEDPRIPLSQSIATNN